MIEVFKTNVDDQTEAALLIQQIAKIHSDYNVNFDLEDCDRILRVKTQSNSIDCQTIIAILKSSGFSAELLEDEMGTIS